MQWEGDSLRSHCVVVFFLASFALILFELQYTIENASWNSISRHFVERFAMANPGETPRIEKRIRENRTPRNAADAII